MKTANAEKKPSKLRRMFGSRFKAGEAVTMYLPVRLTATSLARTSPRQPVAAAPRGKVAATKARAPIARTATASARPAAKARVR